MGFRLILIFFCECGLIPSFHFIILFKFTFDFHPNNSELLRCLYSKLCSRQKCFAILTSAYLITFSANELLTLSHHYSLYNTNTVSSYFLVFTLLTIHGLENRVKRQTTTENVQFKLNLGLNCQFWFSKS